MGAAIIPRRNKKSDVDVIENNGRYWEKSYSGHYLSMPTKANGVWVLNSSVPLLSKGWQIKKAQAAAHLCLYSYMDL